MGKLKFIIVILSIQSICFSAGWLDQIGPAEKIAAEKKLPLLIAFLGPNWCPWSDELELGLLADKGQLSSLYDAVVLLKVEIPKEHAEIDFPGKGIVKRFSIDTCPSLILVDPSWQLMARLDTSHLQTHPIALYVKELLADFREVAASIQPAKEEDIEDLKRLYTKAGKLADQKFKEILLNRGLKRDQTPYFLFQQYGEMVGKGASFGRKLSQIRHKIIARDLDNGMGYHRELALTDFEELVGKKSSPHFVIKPLVEYLSRFGGNDPEHAWGIEMKISQYLFSHGDLEGAIQHAKASFESAPERVKGEILQSIQYLQSSSPSL